ncbi:mandelate racemase/muconate lactonizing enzyme family protein [Desmospora profundinema]|uniref:D-galactarolactone cycloisomerase n=1 Tax=Desmospora profundinema TaxID=1571184 RepID=A0ABU1ILQ8_9BACL|nr:mandelate racemase/muconate lactonizing enzyme family protein [Desmospora profundinema]MDR6225717.1 D-galactarolactone cycloisomerase [Desmospora profundinema]
MIIAEVDTFPLFHRLQEPYGDANGYKKYRTVFLFRIRTRSGLEGWGECTGWLPAVEKEFRGRIIPFLVGKPVTNRSQLVANIKKWNPQAAAGISMALTEILAHHAQVSVCDLWGGARRPSVPVYASFQSYTDRPDWIRRSLTMVEQAVSQGFQQVKIKVGGRPWKEDHHHVTSLLKGLDGTEVEVAVDANQSYDVATALRWNRIFMRWDQWLWFEEPLPLDQIRDYQLLRTRCTIPIAGGENLQEPRRFLPALREGAFDILQPDVLHVGGVDAMRDTLQMIRCHGLQASPHTYDGILSRWYSLLLQGCLSPWSKMKNESIEAIEWDAMENPFSSLLSIQPVAGAVPLPRGPGIGAEWDLEKVERYRWDGSAYS